MNKFLKVLVVALCAVALVVGSVAATVAYLTAKTDAVEHTFAAGNIKIRLSGDVTTINETMVPGKVFTPDRGVTVEANSEKCYLFVKLNKLNGFDTYLTPAMDDGWTLVTDTTDVYYRVVNSSSDPQEFNVFKNITAKPNCTMAQYDELHRLNTTPTLTLTAYAVQYLGFDDNQKTEEQNAAAAWIEAKSLDTTPAETEPDDPGSQE